MEFYNGAERFIEQVENKQISKDDPSLSFREKQWYRIFYGKQEPVGITKSLSTGKIEIDRGRHRLAIAKEKGWRHIPATVTWTTLPIY